MNDLVPVYTVKTAARAEIVKNFLEAEGIPCSIEGEGQVGLAGILDIKLLVQADDADLASKLIGEHERTGVLAEDEDIEGEDIQGMEDVAEDAEIIDDDE